MAGASGSGSGGAGEAHEPPGLLEGAPSPAAAAAPREAPAQDRAAARLRARFVQSLVLDSLRQPPGGAGGDEKGGSDAP
jgi:hypothetical protein